MVGMQEPTFLILTAIANEPLHGYGIIQAVVELSDEEVTLRPGTLYGALERLTTEGLVAIDREEVVEGRLRRYYRLTDHGASVLDFQADRLKRRAATARSRLRRRPGWAFLGGTA